jgi:hypothetical protein
MCVPSGLNCFCRTFQVAVGAQRRPQSAIDAPATIEGWGGGHVSTSPQRPIDADEDELAEDFDDCCRYAHVCVFVYLCE